VIADPCRKPEIPRQVCSIDLIVVRAVHESGSSGKICAGDAERGSYVVALLFLEHGSAKLLGFPTSPHGEPVFMTLMWIQGLIEFAGGASLALGLFTRPVAFILSGNMAVAYFMGHASKGFFPLLNGGDAAILYCFIFLLFFVAGPGRWSLDAELTHDDRRGDRVRGDHYGGRTGAGRQGSVTLLNRREYRKPLSRPSQS
jgi:putative oxidoreductase